jgi:hypothetical protein
MSSSPTLTASKIVSSVWCSCSTSALAASSRSSSLRVQVALAQPVGVDLACHGLIEQLDAGVEVLGMGELLEPPLGEFGGVVPEHVAQRSVDHQEPTVEADQGHADR